MAARQPPSSFQIDTERYVWRGLLGSGAYGVVGSATDTQTNEPVAIKKVSRPLERPHDAKMVLREISIMEHFAGCPRVVQLRRAFQSPMNEVYVVMEEMDSDLARVIKEQVLNDEHIRWFTRQLLKGVAYIHAAGVMHRDLKPSNLLVNGVGCVLKICDFGMARVVGPPEDLTDGVVTRWYRAPEIVVTPRNYGKAVDLYSVGCIVMEMVQRTPLFPADSIAEYLGQVINLLGVSDEDMQRWGCTQAVREALKTHVEDKRKEEEKDVSPRTLTQLLVDAGHASDSLENMITILLAKHGEDRTTAEYLCQHEWLMDGDEEEVDEEEEEEEEEPAYVSVPLEATFEAETELSVLVRLLATRAPRAPGQSSNHRNDLDGPG